MDEENALTELESNAYPYSLPLITPDGLHLLYAHDGDSASVEETRIYATKRGDLDNQFPEGQEIASPPNFEGLGDSNFSVAQGKGFTVAAWVRQSAYLAKEAGEAVNKEEQALLVNGTEIVGSVYRNGQWREHPLTTNSTPDLAPWWPHALGRTVANCCLAQRLCGKHGGSVKFLGTGPDPYSHLYNVLDQWWAPQVLYDALLAP